MGQFDEIDEAINDGIRRRRRQLARHDALRGIAVIVILALFALTIVGFGLAMWYAGAWLFWHAR